MTIAVFAITWILAGLVGSSSIVIDAISNRRVYEMRNPDRFMLVFGALGGYVILFLALVDLIVPWVWKKIRRGLTTGGLPNPFRHLTFLTDWPVFLLETYEKRQKRIEEKIK